MSINNSQQEAQLLLG